MGKKERARRREEQQIRKSIAALQESAIFLRKEGSNKYLVAFNLREEARSLFGKAERIDEQIKITERRLSLKALAQSQRLVKGNEDSDRVGYEDEIDAHPLYVRGSKDKKS